MDHPRALRHPADDEAVPGDARLLRPAIRREDRPRGVVPGIRGEERSGVAHAGEHSLHGQRHADHARREDDHLLGGEPERVGRLDGRRLGIRDSPRTRRGVGDARVHDDGLRLGPLEMPLRDDHGGREHAIRRPHRGTDGRLDRAHEREIEARPPDAGADPRRHEAARSGDAHQTRTPESRRPVVSSSPKRRLTFCTACPAAPLPRLSSAQRTIASPVRRSSKTPISAPSVC